MRRLVVAVALIGSISFGCGKVKDDTNPDGNQGDGGETPVPAASVAPTVASPMYQGGQLKFTTQTGGTCDGRVAASMGGTGFCYLAADDSVKCAGMIGGVNFGLSLASINQTGATQIMVMFLDNGMCITKTDRTVSCMGTNTNAFGTGGTSSNFARWTAHADVAAIASGTWDQICGITTGGQVFCEGGNFGHPAINIGAPGQTSLWVDTFGEARISDPAVLRPAESRTECQVRANGLACGGAVFGPTNGTVVMGTQIQGAGGNQAACWLTTAGDVDCSIGPRFAPGQVLYLAASYYSDSLCAIYKDGAVWCIGTNNNGKLGTGNTLELTTETMVAPPGSARVACD